MATIGILINHYDARNDIRDLVSEISQTHRVILLSKDKSLSHSLPKGVELRPLIATKFIRRQFWTKVFAWFGKIPKSKENYYINELFKLGRLTFFRLFIQKIKFYLRMNMPRFFNINDILPKLSQCDKTNIFDIDAFLLITEFSDIPMLARICDSGKTAWAYLYSWDHPCKHTVLTDRLTGYFVWNDKLANDMEELQNVPVEKCKVIGATQLTPIVDYLCNQPQPISQGKIENKPYFYFGCGTGYAPLSRKEIKYIADLADLIKQEFPDYIFLVRPYPMFDDDSALAELKTKSNVRFDNEFRSFQVGRSLRATDIKKRLDLQRGSACFIHIGTTMGYEAAFLGCPIIFINLTQNSPQNIKNSMAGNLALFAKQYHVQKYLVGDYPSVVHNLSETINSLKIAVQTPRKLLAYNSYISAGTPLLGMSELSAAILDELLKV